VGVLILRHLLTDFAGCAAAGGGLDAATECVLEAGRAPAVLLTLATTSLLRAALSSAWIGFQSAVFTLAHQRLTRNRWRAARSGPTPLLDILDQLTEVILHQPESTRPLGL
jgi:hypothetical protein